jgi:hypothetical protein
MGTAASSPRDPRPPQGGLDDGEPERPLNVLDALVFAPMGLALKAGELLPDALRQGRAEYTKRATTAKLLGKLIVTQQQRKRRLARAGSPSIARRPEAPVTADQRVASPATNQPTDPPTDAATSSPTSSSSNTQSGSPATAADLPIDGYDTLPARSLLALFEGLSLEQLAVIRQYELAHRRRETVLTRLSQLQNGAERPQSG